MAEALECLCDLPKVESQSYKATGHTASTTELSPLVRPLCAGTKGHALECDFLQRRIVPRQ